jgi:uncharacterized membrane protein
MVILEDFVDGTLLTTSDGVFVNFHAFQSLWVFGTRRVHRNIALLIVLLTLSPMALQPTAVRAHQLFVAYNLTKIQVKVLGGLCIET